MAHAASRHSRDLTDPLRQNRAVLNGILWVLRTGAPWADLPDRYPSYQTCHRRFQHWVRAGLLRSMLELLAQALHDEGYLDLQEAFIDGSLAPAKHGERFAENFLGMLHLACCLILLRGL